jgi:hypothetical protein
MMVLASEMMPSYGLLAQGMVTNGVASVSMAVDAHAQVIWKGPGTGERSRLWQAQ